MSSIWSESAVIFPCADGELVAILHKPPVAMRGIGILMVVGGPQYRVGSHRQFVLMARKIAGGGCPVLRFDYRGMGDSSGTPQTFDSVDQDIRAAMNAFLAEIPSLEAVVILALCDGASAALMYCQSDSRLAGLVLINPWVRTEAGQAAAVIRHYYWDRLGQRAFWSKVLSGGFKPRAAFGEFVKNLRRALHPSLWQPHLGQRDFLSRMADGALGFCKPVLLVLSGRDLTAREFEDYCGSSPVWTRWLSSRQLTRVRLEDADHTFSASASLQEASRRILEWLCDLAPEQNGVDR